MKNWLEKKILKKEKERKQKRGYLIFFSSFQKTLKLLSAVRKFVKQKLTHLKEGQKCLALYAIMMIILKFYSCWKLNKCISSDGLQLMQLQQQNLFW